jgi:drug/metabolite transporter (DMT)-like permease
MATLLALVATVLTSFLPILTKRLLQDARPALVAWAINAALLPILAGGTLLLTQCRFLPGEQGLPFSCTAHMPQMDGLFVAALLASVALNWAATLLSTSSLAKADASLVSPLLTFNPAFTLLVAWLTLGETPRILPTLGVGVVLFGAYLLEVEEVQTGLFAPLCVLLYRPGVFLAIGASALWGMTTVFEKLAIKHMNPPSGPAVALLGAFLMVLVLTPGAFRVSKADLPMAQHQWQGLRTHPRALALAVLIAGIAPLFGFTAIALGLVGYVTTFFKLSAVLTILWARWWLGEGQLKSRLLGASVMIVGGILVAR